MKLFIWLLLFLSTLVFAEGHVTQYENPFSIVYGGAGNSIYGDYVSLASSVQCVKKSDGTCDNDYSGYLFDADTKYKNSVSTNIIPLNSSTEALILPSDVDGADILYAGLYWQGNISGNDADNYNTTFSSINDHGGIQGREQIVMVDAKGGTHSLTADKIWYHDFWGNGTGYDGGHRSFYQGYKDVTSIVKNSYDKSQTNTYTIGNIKSSVGTDYPTYFWGDDTHEYNGVRIGFWGNWNLIIVYSHPTIIGLSPQPKAKSITIFQGFDALIPLGSGTTKSINLDLSGFLTPLTLPTGESISAKLLFYGSGAEKKLNYDTFKIQDKKTTSYVDLSNTLNPVDDAFNGSISTFGVAADSSISYYPGLDSDTFDVSEYMDTAQSSTSLALSAYNVNGTGDQIFPGLIAFSTDIYEPEFCYDYAYKQQGVYFTEDNDGSHDPRLTTEKLAGGAISHEPIEVTIYLKSQLDTQVDITDLNISVLDINSTAPYILSTTKKALTGDLIPQTVTDSSSTSTTNIIDVQIGTMNSNDGIYLYYQLDPTQSDLNSSINIQVDYNINIGSAEPIRYSHKIGASHKIQMCSSSNFNYAPAQGIFNIVHNDYYKLDEDPDDSTKIAYYNLPTQVASREGNFKIVSMDPDNLDTPKATETIVAIEMIDASAFHDTNASCEEMESAITQRVWIPIGDLENEINATSALFNQAALATAIANGDVSVKQNFPPLTNSADFYKNVRQNTAFRVSWNVMDENGTLPYITKENNGNTVSLNWTEDWSGEECAQDMVTNGYGNDNKVASYCNFTGGSPDTIAACMECIYGVHTRVVCSRDNFAIRPEAFNLQLDDQNQTNPTQQADITTLSNSGSTGATAPASINLAAGYDYNIEINATNHIDNSAAPGYTRSFNSDLPNDISEYRWEPRTGVTAGACNDESNKSLEIRFVNGKIDANTSVSQVGEYRLHLLDTTWTSVDSDANNTGSHFTGTLDCRPNSSVVLNVNAGINPTDPTTLNGCNITSSHTNTEANIKYNDYNVTFFPYKFDINGSGASNSAILPGVGINHQLIDTTNSFFVYMADINNTDDENMSYHLDGSIAALGENNVTLNNFVDKCYATNLTITIQTTNRDLNDTEGNHVNFIAKFHDLNKTTAQPIASLDINRTDIAPNTVQFSFDTNESHFYKTSNGSIDTYLNLNYQKNVSRTVNPKTVTFLSYGVDCKTGVNCFFNADLITNKTPKMQKDLNTTIPIQFYYGRAHAGKQRYVVPDDAPYKANIYYEIYCFGAGCDANTSIKPVNTNLLHVDDIRWYQNTLHSPSNDGNATAVFEQDGINKVIPTYPFPPLWNSTKPATVQLTYDGSLGYPYTTTMEVNASGWLIYNEDDANATTNSFQVEYNKAGSKWSGEHETNATTDTNGSIKTNRRTMW